MKIWRLLALALVAQNASACDWVVSRKTDPMDDKVTCSVSSASAKVSFYRRGTDRTNVVVASAYREPSLQIRLDDGKAIRMGNNAYDRQKALDLLLPRLNTAKRIRTSFRDYPSSQEGDAPICTLPELLASCGNK